MFWQWPETEAAAQPWVRVAALEFAAGQSLAAHRAPADALLVCVGGSVRFVLEGVEQELQPGDGVVMREGQVHSVAAGSAGRALLFLRRAGESA